MKNGYPDTPDFWGYKPYSPTPDLAKAIASGAIADTTTLQQWESLSPGMRREIVRTTMKHTNCWQQVVFKDKSDEKE